MVWLWVLLGLLVVAAGVRHRIRLHAARRQAGPPRIDDAALRRILERGALEVDEGGPDEPLDLDEAARAEEEFWSEEWDRPDEPYAG